MSADTKKIGQWGEGIAAEYLEGEGYSVLTRNYHAPLGEIDIVAITWDAGTPCLVFVEVKTRTSHKHGFPEEAVNKKKWGRLEAAIQNYFESHPDLFYEWRVDVISVLGHPACENPQIQHFENLMISDERE